MELISSLNPEPKYVLPMFSMVSWHSTSLAISQSAIVWHSPTAKFCSSSKNPRSVGILFEQKLPSDLWIWLRVCKALWVPLGWKYCKAPIFITIPLQKSQLPPAIRKEKFHFPGCSNVQKMTSGVIAQGFPSPKIYTPPGTTAWISVLLQWMCYDAGGRVLMWRYFFHHLYCRRSLIASIWFILLDTPSLWDPSQLLSLSWDTSGRRLCFYLRELSLD